MYIYIKNKKIKPLIFTNTTIKTTTTTTSTDLQIQTTQNLEIMNTNDLIEKRKSELSLILNWLKNDDSASQNSHKMSRNDDVREGQRTLSCSSPTSTDGFHKNDNNSSDSLNSILINNQNLYHNKASDTSSCSLNSLKVKAQRGS
jgi:hypothetical protein